MPSLWYATRIAPKFEARRAAHRARGNLLPGIDVDPSASETQMELADELADTAATSQTLHHAADHRSAREILIDGLSQPDRFEEALRRRKA